MPSGGASAARAHADDLPDSLDRAMIADGVAKVRARAQACGNNSLARGEVKLKVKVEPAGNVASVTVETTPDPDLGDCVGGVLLTAKFPRTNSGGSFAYPFQF